MSKKTQNKPLKITPDQIDGFELSLGDNGKTQSTRTKYLSAVRQYADYLGDQVASRGSLVAWREDLIHQSKYQHTTINGMLTGVNAFFAYLGREDDQVSLIAIQERSYRDDFRDLNRDEYFQMAAAARAHGLVLIALVLATLCNTGIRASELVFLTVASLKAQEFNVYNKKKSRMVRIPDLLAIKLKDYIAAQGITSGPIFLNKRGNPLNRHQIWEMVKWAAKAAGIDSTKAYPHNFRHLFAKEFYEKYRDLEKLANILGHDDINTTRKYLLQPASEHGRQIDELDLMPKDW